MDHFIFEGWRSWAINKKKIKYIAQEELKNIIQAHWTPGGKINISSKEKKYIVSWSKL